MEAKNLYNLSEHSPFEINSELLKEFLDDFNSEATRTTYGQALKAFESFLKERFKEVQALTEIERKMIVDYKNFIAEAGGLGGARMAPNTITKHLGAISSFFNFLINKEIITSNPASTVKRPRREVVRPTKAISFNQVEELFESVDRNSSSGPLHLALLATLWLTGLRKSEVLNLKRKDYYKENGDVIIQYMGKGGKFRRKLVHPRLEEIIDDYLLWMKNKGRSHDNEDWLFQPNKNPKDPTLLDRPLNPRTLNRIVEKYSKKIGVNFNVSPHSARATFISLLLEAEVPIADVAKEVSHSSIKTTQEYDKRRSNLKKSLVKKLPF